MKNKFTAASIRDPGFVGKDKEQAACIEEGGGGVCVCVCMCVRESASASYIHGCIQIYADARTDSFCL